MGNRPCCREGEAKAVAAEEVSADTAGDISTYPDLSPSNSSEYPQVGQLGSTEMTESMAARKPPSRVSRLKKLKHLEIDMEILRGADLRRTLFHCGKIWLKPPGHLNLRDRAALWTYSTPVQGFDTFLSHTWLTPGRLKALSLTLQRGWPVPLIFFGAATVLAMALCMYDIVPMPWTNTTTITGHLQEYPLGPWVLLCGFLALLLGIVLAPYFPTYSETVFVDVFSIHQTDAELMERGIYGLAGCLRMSKQMQVLWSPPYLSRLWCIFEIAAFRKANPEGKILWTPLFLERAVLVVLVMSFGMASLHWFLIATKAGLASTFLSYMFAYFPCGIGVHALRRSFLEGAQLLNGLQHFDLNSAGCSLEFDRLSASTSIRSVGQFIYTAILDWYDSEEAFTQYVRGPLHEELAASASSPCLCQDGALFGDCPLGYFLIILAVPVSLSLEFALSLFKGGAPGEAILRYVIGTLLGFDLAWTTFGLVNLRNLCYHFAAPRCRAGSAALDFGQSMLIVMCVAACYALGTEATYWATESSLWASTGWACFAFLCAFLALKGKAAVAAFGVCTKPSSKLACAQPQSDVMFSI